MSFPITFGAYVGTAPMNALDQMFQLVGQNGITRCTCSGTNSLTITPTTNQATLTAYAANQFFSFVVANGNTSSVNVNIGGLGSIPLLQANGTVLASGQLTAGMICLIGTDGVGNAWLISGTALPGNIAFTDVDTQWTKRVDGPATVQLTLASSTAWDMSRGNTFQLVLTANTTMAAPTSGRDGQTGILYLTQDSTGGRTVSWNAAYDFGTAGQPTISSGASKTTRISFSVLGTTPLMASAETGF